MSRAATRTDEQDAKQAAKTRSSKCVHHWIIETPNGRESHGLCRRCGATKSFSNSTESVMWEQTNTLRNDLRESTRFSKATEIRLSDEE